MVMGQSYTHINGFHESLYGTHSHSPSWLISMSSFHDSSRLAVVSPTPRSSFTIVAQDTEKKAPSSASHETSSISPLEQEISRDEARFEMYGGDDVDDPPAVKHMSPPDHSAPDPNLVSWDGPGDPSNPQNWSRTYKWIITLICALMTI